MRQTVALIVSIALGLVAVFAMKMYLDREKQSTRSQYETVNVLVAVRRLPIQHRITKEDIRPFAIPQDCATPDMCTPDKEEQIVGRILRREIFRAGFITESDFNKPEVRGVSNVPKGRRLISLPVNQISGVSGLIQPGNHVDILYTFNYGKPGASEQQYKTILLLGDVTVHATDHYTVMQPQGSSNKFKQAYSAVTLSVTPEESSLLASTGLIGKFTMTLRPSEDFSPSIPSVEITMQNLETLARQVNEKRQGKKETPNKP